MRYIKRINQIKESKDTTFRFNPVSEFFERLYYPSIFMEADDKVGFLFTSPGNYDITIELIFDFDGKFITGSIKHEVKDWEYDYDDYASIVGFKNNHLEFRILKRISSKIVSNNSEGLKNDTISTKDLESQFKQSVSD